MRQRALLALSHQTEQETVDLAGNIGTLAQTSALALANPTVASGAAAVVVKAKAYADSRKKASDTAKQAADAQVDADADLEALRAEIGNFAGCVCNVATTAADLTSCALTPRPKVTVPTTLPDVPDAFVITKPRYLHGFADIAVKEPAGVHGRYVAEWSADPIGTPGTWTRLAGTGKSRRVTGASGTKVWVRFARVRGQLESAWSEPQLVLIP